MERRLEDLICDGEGAMCQAREGERTAMWTLEPASSGTPAASDPQSRLTISLMNGGGPSIDRFNDLVTELLNSGFL